MIDDARERFLEHLGRRDRGAALDVVRRLRAGGSDLDALVSGVLGPAQRRVGELWEADEWDVAQEHAATAIVDASLADCELALEAPSARGQVVVACAEGEWHALPARMLAAQLQARSWSVTFLGASVPAAHLGRLLDATRPVALAVSCTVSRSLPGAGRSIAAAHDHGIPAVVGGAGFGGDDRRARALGADAWLRTADQADALLDSWSRSRPKLRAPSTDPAALALRAVRSDVATAATQALAALRDDAQDDEAGTLQALHELLGFVEAAVLTRDERVLLEYLGSLRSILHARHQPAGVVPLILAAVRAALPPEHAGARALLARHAASAPAGSG
jgi:methanogenic corrinoid protein MtbC1